MQNELNKLLDGDYSKEGFFEDNEFGAVLSFCFDDIIIRELLSDFGIDYESTKKKIKEIAEKKGIVLYHLQDYLREFFNFRFSLEVKFKSDQDCLFPSVKLTGKLIDGGVIEKRLDGIALCGLDAKRAIKQAMESMLPETTRMITYT